jgi:hypothetical protein
MNKRNHCTLGPRGFQPAVLTRNATQKHEHRQSEKKLHRSSSTATASIAAQSIGQSVHAYLQDWLAGPLRSVSAPPLAPPHSRYQLSLHLPASALRTLRPIGMDAAAETGDWIQLQAEKLLPPGHR